MMGEKRVMQIHKVIRRRIRRKAGGADFVGDVNAAISVNVGEPSSTSHVSSRSSVSSRDNSTAVVRAEQSAETQQT
jgi:hypothetical protein